MINNKTMININRLNTRILNKTMKIAKTANKTKI